MDDHAVFLSHSDFRTASKDGLSSGPMFTKHTACPEVNRTLTRTYGRVEHSGSGRRETLPGRFRVNRSRAHPTAEQSRAARAATYPVVVACPIQTATCGSSPDERAPSRSHEAP